MAVQLKYKKIIKKLRHSSLYERAKGIDLLRKCLKGSIYTDSLQYLLEEAGGSFPQSVEEWDDGSYHLVGFCSEFPHSDLVTPIVKNFERYSERAKLQALFLLININSDVARDAYIQIIETYSQEFDLEIDVRHIFEQTEWSPQLVKRFVSFLDQDKLAPSIYHLLLICHRSENVPSFANEEIQFIQAQIKKTYEHMKKNYLPYDSDYNLHYVYEAWKDSYLKVRSQIGVLLQLMQYYFDEEIQKELVEALHFKDPFLKVDAVISLIERDYSIDKSIIESCANNIESCVWLYNRLQETSKEHLYDLPNDLQNIFVKNRLFNYLINQEDFEIVPDDIEVVQSYETTNYYGQEITYFLTKFRSNRYDWEDKGWMTAFVGEYLTKDLPSPKIVDNTTTSFTPWKSKSIDEHLNELERLNTKQEDELNREVISESKPSWHWGTIFLGVLTMGRTFMSISNNDPIYYSLVALLWIVLFYKVFATFKLRNETKVTLKIRELTVMRSNGNQTIQLHTIHRMSIEQRKLEKTDGKMASYQRKVKYIVFFDEHGNELLSFPVNFVKPEKFLREIQLLTEHLNNPPIIDVIEEDLSA